MRTKSSRLIVLDDDPTGIQTVHSCLVITRWTQEILERCLSDDVPFFYIITNTRAMTGDKAAQTIREVTRAIRTAADRLERSFNILCRSDSTLRGHFPLELNTVVEELGSNPDARFFVPAFFEAGRYTADDTQWIDTPDGPLDCGQSDFAKDSVFAYSTGHLPTYIAEKTGCDAEDVIRFNADDAGGNLEKIAALRDGPWCIVNCRNYEAMDRFTAAVRAALAAGRNFVFQSSSSFPRSYAGLNDRPLAAPATEGGPGIVIVGSHVPLSTRQLKYLLDSEKDIEALELPVARLLSAPGDLEIDVAAKIENAAKSGCTPVLYTSREELRLDGGEERLAAGEAISRVLCNIIRGLSYRPAFILSKGGITSHTTLRDGLGVGMARVAGPAAPGIPSLILPDDHRWAGVPYVIFPGNVGTETTLAEVYRRMSGKEK